MGHISMYLLVVFALVWKTSDGVSKPKFPCSDDTCPPSILPDGASCFIHKLPDHACKYLKLNESLGEAKLNNTASPLADVNLGVYQYQTNSRSYPNLNISYSNIKFTSVMVRVSVQVQLSETLIETRSVCKNFTIHNAKQNMDVMAGFFYDCRWFDHQSQYITNPDTLEHHAAFPMTLEYQAASTTYAQYKKLFFQLPPNGTVDTEKTDPLDFQLLIYREDDGRCMHFYWSRPPEKFEVSHYRVTLYDVTNNLTEPIQYETKETHRNFCEIPKAHNLYKISVEPWLKIVDKYGSPSYSEKFYTRTSSFIAVVLLVALVILLLILLLLGFWYSIKLYSFKRRTQFKKCIVVFEPSCTKHLTVVKELVLFLRGLEVPVRFAETDIKKHQRATDWYSTELDKAELVLIVSNQCPTSEISTASIYFNIYKTGYVEARLEESTLTGPKSKRFIRILLPYCKKKSFYGFTETMPCRHIFKDRFRLLQDILGPYVWLPAFVTWPLYSSYFKTDGWRRLKSAIDNFKITVEDMNMGNEMEYNQSQQSLTKSSTISFEVDLCGVEDRNQKLQEIKDEDTSDDSGSEPESYKLNRYADPQQESTSEVCNTEDKISVSEVAMNFF